MEACCDLEVDINGEEVFMVDKVTFCFVCHSHLLKLTTSSTDEHGSLHLVSLKPMVFLVVVIS